MFKPILAAFKTLRSDAERKAPTWKKPKSKGKDYSCSLAKKQLSRSKTKSTFKSSFLGRNSWKIRKNRLGVPLERTKPGYLFHKPKGQKWCQLTSYTLTEVYAGGGRYKKAKGVRFGFSRFQACR